MDIKVTPTEWFDRFLSEPDFGSVKGRLPWWCARHWAPCPLADANGIGMVIDLGRIFLDETPSAHQLSDIEELNKIPLTWTTPFCCQLGDKRMYELWTKWGWK